MNINTRFRRFADAVGLQDEPIIVPPYAQPAGEVFHPQHANTLLTTTCGRINYVNTGWPMYHAIVRRIWSEAGFGGTATTEEYRQ